MPPLTPYVTGLDNAQTETGLLLTTETGLPLQLWVSRTPGWVTVTRYTPQIKLTRIGALITPITAGTTLMFVTQFIDGLSGLAANPTSVNAKLVSPTGVVTALVITPYTALQPVGAYLIAVEFVEPGKNTLRIEGTGAVDVVQTHIVDVKADVLV